MEINITNTQEQFELAIQLYAEIIYHTMQSNPQLYDELIPKSSFKLKELKEEEQYQTLKIAA